MPAPTAGTTGAATRGGAAARLATPAFAAAWVALLALLWTLLPAALQTVPHADNVEQLNWSHSLEWGYLKHPPLPTWLTRAGIALFGPSALLTYALAMACVALTLLLLWRCARLLFDREGAACALLLCSANYYLMGRGSFLNHNTVMLPFVAASAWAVLRIVQGGAGWPVWLLLGLAQALGLLTKYQMAVVIAANALALLLGGAWRQPRFAVHLALASLATLLPLLPHVLWLQHHDFSTFDYAGQSLLADLPWLRRLRHAASFAAQQVGRFAPALVAAGLGLLLARPTRAAPPQPPPAPAAASGRALAALALTPVLLVFALAIFFGVALQNHWGSSTTLLLPLLAVAAWPALRAVGPSRLLATVALVQLAAAAWNVVAAQQHPEFHYRFPARALAAQAQAYWSEHADGRLAVLIGPDWETGALSLELPSHPDVLASGERRQAPWVDDARLARCGALVFWRADQPAAAQVGALFAASAADARELQAPEPQGGTARLQVGYLAPQGGGC
jgi:4-amino-4-deoxy-L-arabinose transferase-like glycosyltransferase